MFLALQGRFLGCPWMEASDSTQQAAWPPTSNRNGSEARQEIQARLCWGPAAAERAGTNNASSAWLLHVGGVGSWFLIWGEGQGVLGQAGRGWFRVVHGPLVVWSSKGHAVPCFCSVGFILLNLPQPCMHAVIFSPAHFLCILLLEGEAGGEAQAPSEGPQGPCVSHFRGILEN